MEKSLRQTVIDWLDDNFLFGDAATMIHDDDMSFLKNGILTSLGFVRLMLYLEDTYGVSIDRKDWDAGIAYVDRLLDNRIARFAFGDSTAKRRDLHDDPQLRKALDLLKRGQSQRDLLALAAMVPVKQTK